MPHTTAGIWVIFSKLYSVSGRTGSSPARYDTELPVDLQSMVSTKVSDRIGNADHSYYVNDPVIDPVIFQHVYDQHQSRENRCVDDREK